MDHGNFMSKKQSKELEWYCIEVCIWGTWS